MSCAKSAKSHASMPWLLKKRQSIRYSAIAGRRTGTEAPHENASTINIVVKLSTGFFYSLVSGMKRLLIILSLAAPQVHAQQWEAPQPYAVETIRQWQRSFENWPWVYLPEQEVKLNGGTETQLLLAVSGGARSGTFILFARNDNEWLQSSENIEQAHHPVYVLEAENNGWHDFMTFSPLWGSGGNEVLVSTYHWDGTKYIFQQRQAGKWCEYEPFRSDSTGCPDR